MNTNLTAETLATLTGCTVEQAAYCITARDTDERRIALARLKTANNASKAQPRAVEPLPVVSPRREMTEREAQRWMEGGTLPAMSGTRYSSRKR